MIFDFETDGLGFYLNHIIEFGYVLLVDGVVEKEGDVLVNWEIEIPEIITELTHITKDMIDKDGISPNEFYKLITQLLNENDLLIAHNISFDCSMLHNFLCGMGHKNGIDDFDIDHFDSLTLVSDFIAVGKKPRKPSKNWANYEQKMVVYNEKIEDIQSHKVTSVCKYFNISPKNFHRALADVEAVYEILIAFSKKFTEIDLEYYVNKWGYKKKWKINEMAYYPLRVSLYPQGDKGEKYILYAEQEKLF